MKKLIALLLVFAVFSTTVFAAPLSLVTSLGNEFPVKTETSQELDLFADVGAIQLTDMEASAVEGEGFWGALIGAIVGAAAVAISGGNVKDILSGAASGATVGGLLSGAF